LQRRSYAIARFRGVPGNSTSKAYGLTISGQAVGISEGGSHSRLCFVMERPRNMNTLTLMSPSPYCIQRLFFFCPTFSGRRLHIFYSNPKPIFEHSVRQRRQTEIQSDSMFLSVPAYGIKQSRNGSGQGGSPMEAFTSFGKGARPWSI